MLNSENKSTVMLNIIFRADFELYVTIISYITQFFSSQEVTYPVKMDKFFYFAYGSNMLEQRIHIKNPSAEKMGIGKLNVSNNNK